MMSIHIPTTADYGYYAQLQHPSAFHTPDTELLGHSPPFDIHEFVLTIPPETFECAFAELKDSDSKLVLAGEPLATWAWKSSDYIASMQPSDADPLGQHGLLSMVIRELPSCSVPLTY